MKPLPLMLAHRLARQAGVTVARVQDLWQQWLAQFEPVRELVERSWDNVPDAQAALADYQAWTGGLAAAEQQVAQDFSDSYFHAITAQLAQRAWAGTGS
jgi:hypothetical protein